MNSNKLCMNVSSIFINQNMAVNGKRPEAVQGRLDGQLVIAEGVDDSLLKVQIELAIMAKQCNERSLVSEKYVYPIYSDKTFSNESSIANA